MLCIQGEMFLPKHMYNLKFQVIFSAMQSKDGSSGLYPHDGRSSVFSLRE